MAFTYNTVKATSSVNDFTMLDSAEAADDTKKVAAAKAALESRKAHSMAEAVRDIVTRGNAAGPAVANYKEQNMAFPREVVAEEVGRIVLAHVGKLPGLMPEVAAALLADPIREAEALRGWPGIPKAYLGGFLFGQTKPRFDNRIPTAGEQMLQGQYRQDFAGYVTANKRTEGAGNTPVRGTQITRR